MHAQLHLLAYHITCAEMCTTQNCVPLLSNLIQERDYRTQSIERDYSISNLQ